MVEWQPTEEEMRRAIGYAGRDFAKPRLVREEFMSTSWDESWTLDEFREILDSVPAQFADKALVDFERGDDWGGKICVFYERLETPEEVAAHVARVRQYVEDCAAKEIADYERLRAKFG